MKKMLAMGLALLLLVLPLGSFAQEGEDFELVVGTPTQMSGYFFNEMWGNNTADMDVRALLHGYSNVAWERDGNFGVDPTVVREVTAQQNAQGDKIYTYVLNEDLVYNDGTPITAKDYVFSALFISSPQAAQIGAVPTSLQHLVGYEDFQLGEPFSGIRLLGDYEFSLTISADYLPYYYELMLTSVTPYPMFVIAPDCDVVDDGKGAYIAGPFSTELLERTVMDEDNGYLYMPTVTSGPYSLYSYNRVTNQARFVKNDLYRGNFEGQKPTFERITFRQVESDTMMDQLESGEIHLINKASSGDAINRGLAQVAAGNASAINYLRAGMTFISFACEMGPTTSQNVRQAIAMCVDVGQITDDYLLGYGMPVYGYYGYGQWMVAQNQERLMELAAYELNVVGAINLLEEDGWILNAAGQPFDPEIDAVRYRETEDGGLEALVIAWARPEASGMTDMLQTMVEENFRQAGIGLEVTAMPFTELLTYYYRQQPRTYHMFNLASNFSLINDPYYTFHTGEEYQGVINATGIQDEHLMELARQMSEVDSDDSTLYMERWLDFQTYWAQVLPMVPMYSNIYFDFTIPELQDYYVNSFWSWGAAILYASIGEPQVTTIDQVEEDGLTPLEEDDGLVFEEDGTEELTFLD